MDTLIASGGGERIYLELGYLMGPLKGQVPKRAYGSSAGALIISIFAAQGIDVAHDVLMGIRNTSQIFITKNPAADIGDEIFRNFPGLTAYGPLLALIQKYIVGKPSFPVTILRTNFENGKVQYVTWNTDGSFTTEGDDSTRIVNIMGFQGALCSSCINGGATDAYLDYTNGQNLPGVPYIDGGYSDLIPTPKAIADGCTDLTILMTGLFSDPALNNKGGDLVAGIEDGYSIFVHRVMRDDIMTAINNPNVTTVVYEMEPVGSSSVFDDADDLANYNLGLSAQAVPGSAFLP